MCGIYGLVSSRNIASPPGDEFFHHLTSLLEKSGPETLAAVLAEESKSRSVLEILDTARKTASRWMGRGAFLALSEDSSAVERLSEAVARINQWVAELERLGESGSTLRQAQREVVNRLIVGGKDVAWQIEEDVIGNLERVRGLVDERLPVALSRAYEVNLILRSLDRLELLYAGDA